MKKLTGLFIFLVAALSAQNNCQQLKQSAAAAIYNSPENLRSDTFNILKYTIALTIGNSGNQQIGGYTDVRFVPKMNNRTFLRLDLLKMQIDSIREGTIALTYVYNDTLLKINFASPKNTTDTSTLRIYYHGQPVIDQTGWGGFYFDNTQGQNMPIIWALASVQSLTITAGFGFPVLIILLNALSTNFKLKPM